MPIRSKTGLMPTISSSSNISYVTQTTIDFPKLSSPAPYVLRPFAGVYNPFPYGCSVLCNHPADYEAKDIVRKAKETWVLDGRPMAPCDGFPTGRSQRQTRAGSRIDDTVPEELFRKYTETDSRPITPAPTVASIVTRSSQARRCMTPDPVSSVPAREKTMLVLDLRRSHSQETLNWIGGDIPSTVLQPPTRTPSRSASSIGNTSASPPLNKKKKALKTRSSSTKDDSTEDTADVEASQRLKQQVTSVKGLTVPEGQAAVDGSGTDRSIVSSTEGDAVKRRGKKKKGKKGGRDGESEFKGIPDPGETQVSSIVNDSRSGSTRPSLTPGITAEILESQVVPDSKVPKTSKVSFLDPDILRQLQRQLDQEMVESEFNDKRKIALEEALRNKCPAKLRHQGEELKSLKKQLQLPASNPEKWLNIPRTFSRRSARFELPMDSRMLNSMTPLEYAQRYVFASSERIVLYNQVFNLHREELDEDEQVERSLLGKNVLLCLGEIMGRPLTEEEATDFQELIGWTSNLSLDFRTFVGVAALCERLLAPRFIPKMPSHHADPRHQVEQADFESLARKLVYLKPDPRIVTILIGIRDR